jgi:hypothetical protein
MPAGTPVRRVASTKAGMPAKIAPPAHEDMDGAAWALFTALKEWRDRKAQAQDVPHYAILQDTTLRAIAVTQPQNDDALLACPGIGPRKLEQYGQTIVAIVKRCVAEERPDDGVPREFVAPPPAGPTPTYHEERIAEARKLHARAFERWTPEEDERLTSLFAGGATVDDVSRTLERQPNAVRIRGERLGILTPADGEPATVAG